MDPLVISIKNLRLRTFIGVYDWEQAKKQDVIINITLSCDCPEAMQSDKIVDTVDYREITKQVTSLVEGNSFNLLERMVDRILTAILEDKRILSATVEVDKPGALRFTDSVSVTHTRRRC